MLPNLTSIFERKCSEHVSLKLLAAQWDFDKILLSNALQNIQINFSHYSRHDASHSRQILTNIERILGEKIEFFTATDIWLLLEAAYSHDLGMVITQKQISDLDTDEFKYYVKELTEDSENELYEFATNWVTEKAQLPQGSKSYKFINKYKQLIAEWYRRCHSQNSSKYIKDPVIEIGLNSPRNELLPKRLFNILGDICACHGLSFTDVMKLPYSEAGLGVDDCHPRFIACLLRMGDLLDVDDNRFCPVMMNASGDSLPDSSILHFEKHQSIKHLRIDSERIKIEVECITPEVYEVAYDWFRWVENEYHCQSKNWPKIVPNKEFGKLPSLSTPLVTVKKPYVILHEGEKPSFRINTNKTLSMFRSAGLYNEEFDFIREVLQNAVDATLIAIWFNSKKELNHIRPYADEFSRIASEYEIESIFEKNEDKIKISIQDKGIGISRDELDNIINVGGIRSKTKKNQLISEMPQWLKPSGNFGIGLQSLFLVTDSFKITTKNRVTDDCYEIEFFAKNNKGIEIKEICASNVNYGTLVEFNINAVRFPKAIKYNYFHNDEVRLAQLFNNYDITDCNSDLGGYQLFRLIEGVDKFNLLSPIKINNDKVSESKNLRCFSEKSFFSEKTNICLDMIDFVDDLSGTICDVTFFKGQRFKGINRVLPIVRGCADYYGYDAVDFLSYNRSDILKSAIGNAVKNLNDTILEYISTRFNDINDDKKPLASAYCFINDGDEKYIDSINKLKVEYNSEYFNFRTLCEKIKNKEITETVVCTNRHDKLDEQYGYIQVSSLVQHLLKLILTKDSIYWVAKKYDPISFQDRAIWSFDDTIPLDKEKGRDIFLGKVSNFFIGNRIIFPCWGKYRKLSIDIDVQWVRIIEHVQNKPSYMILPFKINYDNKLKKDTSNELIDWIYNSLVEKIDRGQIKKLIEELYNELVSQYDLEGCII